MEWELQSVVNTVSAISSSVFPSSSTDPSHKVQFFENRLLQSKSRMSYSSCQKICSSVGFSPRAAVPASSLLQNGLPTGCSSLQGTSTCSSVECSTACRVEIPTVILQQAAGDSLPHHDLPWACRGISALTHEAPPVPPSLILGVLQGCFPHAFLILTHRCNTAFFTLNMLLQISIHTVDGLSFGQ